MTIPLVDLTKQTTLSNSILSEFRRIVSKGSYVLSEQVTLFEKQFAKYLQVPHTIGVASGTDALLLTLKALNIGKGDEVIVPAMSFIATASPVIHVGATPVFVDILPDSPNINPQLIEKKITKKTKAIIPVHLHGFPAAMKDIKKIAKKHKLIVIEDACQAHGSFYEGKPAGSLGDIAIFSFYPSKNLGAFGDGGAIATANKTLASRLKQLRNHGEKTKYVSVELGFNSRLDTLQAVVLGKKLQQLDKWNTARRKLAARYNKLLRDLPLTCPQEESLVKGNYHLYSIRSKKRDALLTFLQEKNIHCGIHYPVPLHLQPSLKFLGYKKNDFPEAEKFAKENLSLPMFPELTQQQQAYITKQIRAFFEK